MFTDLLDNAPIEFQCPICGFYNEATLKQVRLRDIIICRGCKASIYLDDYMNELRRATKTLRRELKALSREIDKLNRAFQ